MTPRQAAAEVLRDHYLHRPLMVDGQRVDACPAAAALTLIDQLPYLGFALVPLDLVVDAARYRTVTTLLGDA